MSIVKLTAKQIIEKIQAKQLTCVQVVSAFIDQIKQNEKYNAVLEVFADAMDKAIKETNRRRLIQDKYNKDHNIIPQTIIKDIKETPTTDAKDKPKEKMSKKDKELLIIRIEKEMNEAAKRYDFERAMELRDALFELKGI